MRLQKRLDVALFRAKLRESCQKSRAVADFGILVESSQTSMLTVIGRKVHRVSHSKRKWEMFSRQRQRISDSKERGRRQTSIYI